MGTALKERQRLLFWKCWHNVCNPGKPTSSIRESESGSSSISRLAVQPPRITQNLKLLIKSAASQASPTTQLARRDQSCVCFQVPPAAKKIKSSNYPWAAASAVSTVCFCALIKLAAKAATRTTEMQESTAARSRLEEAVALHTARTNLAGPKTHSQQIW